MIGRTISHYEITEKLGEGGMGVVYKARDSHLKRFVALKVLPPEKVTDPERKQRFVQEARAASALNHPNIVTVHDIDQADGVDFIAMEYVEGRTLEEKTGRKGLKLNEALKYAIQIADALAKAHSAGIVHRDLKPGNVMVTGDGRVKVLDFGLAKLTETAVRPEDETKTAQASTEVGMIVGTASYMSPEQAEGKKVDARSDIFSFGSLLYEMLTGRGAFRRDTPALTLAAILHMDPAPLPAECPPEVARVITRCLRKDPERRFQHMGDVKVALEEVKEESESGTAVLPVPARRARARWAWATIAAAVFALAASVYLFHGRPAINSIAVLPFANAGSDPNAEYVSDGLTEQTINSLAELPNLRVIARATAFAYKAKSIDPKQVGKDLRVHAILMGTVVQRGDNLVVQADLVDTDDGSQLWGQQFTRKADELQSVHEEIVRRITERLRLKLTEEDDKRLAKRYTETPEAYNLYTQGRHYLDEETPETIRKSQACFEQAIAKDPNYALAHAGLADSYSYLALYGLEPSREVMPKAREEALRAIQIDDAAGEGHTALGIVKLFSDWDFATAGQELRRAAELSPNNFYVRHWYAHYLEWSGRLPEAMPIMQKILDADPLSPMILEDVYIEYVAARQLEQALGTSRRLLAVAPNDPVALGSDPLIYEALGRREEAAGALEKLRAASGSAPSLRVNAGIALALMGKRSEAQRILADLKEATKKERIPNRMGLSLLCMALGDKDQGFAYLDQDYDARDPGLAILNNMFPWFDFLLHEPRWAAFKRKVGLPEIAPAGVPRPQTP